MRNKPSSVLFLFLTAIIWGFAFVAQVSGGEYLGTYYFNGIRFLLGAVSLIPVIMIFERESKSKNKHTYIAGIGAGVILCIAANLQQIGINITGSPGKGGFLTALYTVFVPILAAVFMGKRTNRNSWTGAVLALVGLFFILSGNMQSNETPIISAAFDFSAFGGHFGFGLSLGFGDIALIFCAIAFAIHIVYIDYFNSTISPIKFSCAQFFTCGIISLFAAVLLKEPISASAVKSALIPLLYGGIMSTGVAYTMQIVGQKGVHPTVSAIILSTESMFAAIGGAMILGERLTNNAYIGCVIMMVGIIISQIPVKRK